MTEISKNQTALKIISPILKNFQCKDNKDIETYIFSKAIEHEKRDFSRTYLIFDKKKFENGEIQVEAFYTLALKPLSIENCNFISNTKFKKLNGYSSGKEVKQIAAYLIAQIGRNDLCSKNDLPGENIFKTVFNTIKEAQDIVAGNVILLECEDKPKLINIYNKYNFELIQASSNTETNLIQMYRFLD